MRFQQSDTTQLAMFWLVIIVIVVVVAIIIYGHNQAWFKSSEERQRESDAAARSRWNRFHESATMEEVAGMTGRAFEEFLARLLTKMGYSEITLTPNNDQGGDILCRQNGARVVVQAKRWKGAVGNAAVQELIAAMLYYDCAAGLAVTNSRFTGPARQLAAKDSRILLCDGSWLTLQIAQYLPPQIPTFSWREFNRTVKNSSFSGSIFCPLATWMEPEFAAAEAREDVICARDERKESAHTLPIEQHALQKINKKSSSISDVSGKKADTIDEKTSFAYCSGLKLLQVSLEGIEPKIVQFKYNGGSKLGEIRTVLVKIVTECYIEGFDLGKDDFGNAYRIYRGDRIEGDIRVYRNISE
jgi:hypothetical protein